MPHPSRNRKPDQAHHAAEGCPKSPGPQSSNPFYSRQEAQLLQPFPPLLAHLFLLLVGQVPDTLTLVPGLEVGGGGEGLPASLWQYRHISFHLRAAKIM